MSFMFFAVNMLNNWAFAFSISVPLHIILRSFGSVTTLFIGWLYGKKYSSVQIFSVVVLTVGVVISAWADAESKGKDTSMSLTGSKEAEAPSGGMMGNFIPGLTILFVAQVLSAYMGVYTENTYARYGRHWRQVLFYSHVFGLAFSVFMAPILYHQLRRLWYSPGAAAGATSLLPDSLAEYIAPHFESIRAAPTGKALLKLTPPQGMWLLLLNSLTQVACISGVNRLSSQTTAVTVTVVLNIRKLVSFLLSCVIFGNKISGTMAVGASVVFGAGAVYGWDSGRRKQQQKAGRRESVDASKEWYVKRRQTSEMEKGGRKSM